MFFDWESQFHLLLTSIYLTSSKARQFCVTTQLPKWQYCFEMMKNTTRKFQTCSTHQGTALELGSEAPEGMEGIAPGTEYSPLPLQAATKRCLSLHGLKEYSAHCLGNKVQNTPNYPERT